MGDSESESGSETGMMEVERGEGGDNSSEEETESKAQPVVQNGVRGGEDSENVEGSESDEGEGGEEEDEGEEMQNPAEIANGAEADSESSDGDEEEDVEDVQVEELEMAEEEEEEEGEDDGEVSSMSEAEDSVPSKKQKKSSPPSEPRSPRKRGRPPKKSSPDTPPKQTKGTRGRPKRLKENDIMKQLDEDDEDEDDAEEDEESDDGQSRSSASPKFKRRKMEEEDESRRRSGRERKVPKKFEAEVQKKSSKKKKKKVVSESSGNEESDSEYESKKKKKTKPKKIDKFNIYKKSPPKVKRKKKKATKVNDDSDDDCSDGEVRKQYKSQRKNWTSLGERKNNARKTERKKYQEEDETHSSDVRSDFDPKDAVLIPEEEIEGIDFVLDHRVGKVGATGELTMHWNMKNDGDPNVTLETEETEQQFLIKWSGWSHLNNTWESEATLKAKKKGDRDVKGIRKLANYQMKLAEFNAWKKRANPEDVEFQEIDIEMGRQLLTSYIEVERIFAQRKNEQGGLDYYVKWKNLPYSEATWEDESVLVNYYPEDLAVYTTRKKAKTNPRNYADAMKSVKKKFTPMKEQPSYLGSETLKLRDYQLDGINFLLNAWAKGCSTILADEMGLGKTIQSITFLKYIFHNFAFKGPMLVVVPLSTMAAWQKEFAQWAPDMNMVCYIGDGKSRDVIRKFECENASGELTFNALLTNYEMVCKDQTFFQDIVWSNIVVDEAHRLKNETSLLYKVLLGIESHHRLLLTGTPLQNSLKELWCLLKYLQLPNIDIDSWDEFEANYGTAEDRATGYVKLHSLLKPFIIRRMKKDVEKSLPPKVEQILRVEMTLRQKKYYKLVLTKNYDALSKGKNQISLLNIMMQLRKCCNHLELINEEEDIARDPQERLHQLIYGSGKLLLLDKLLTRFREAGDRVLIFSQMVIMLNIMEEFLTLRRYPFQRLDGGVSNDKRKQAIAQFNDPNSPDFCFLLSTKAGGLGINLQTANSVVIFDSDWNPQNDLQAIARAHRIGQKEEVKIFRLVASSSVDEDIIHRAKNKMVLDHLVIQSMDTTGKGVISGAPEKKGSTPFNKSELNMILKFGAEDLFKTDETAEDQEKEVDLDSILQSAETREDEEAPQSEANKELLGAFKCTNIAFEEEEMEEEEKEDKDWSEIIPSAMVEMHREKTGIDAYSDPEELFNPIAMRRKKRVKKKFERFAAEGESGQNSAAPSRDGSGDDGEDDDGDDSNDSDMTDGEREMMKELKRRNSFTKNGSARGTYAKKSVICLECKKCFVDRKGLKKHMREVHRVEGWTFSSSNVLDAFPQNTDSPADSGPEQGPLHGMGPETLAVTPKKKRGPPQGNTRCFACGKAFQHRLGYKMHIKSRHEGVEPPENLDPANLALPDDRIQCLCCQKKFTNVLGLKGHIQRVHLGMQEVEVEDVAKEQDEDEGKDTNGTNEVKDEQDEEGKEAPKKEVKLEPKPVSQEDARLIEKMYYMMRRYGCQYCPARFNNKGKLAMHESIHAKDKKPVVCPHCEKSYSRRDKLRKHIERIHPGKDMPESTGLTPPEKPKKEERVSPVRDVVAYPQVSAKLEQEDINEMEALAMDPVAARVKVIEVEGETKFACPECTNTFEFHKQCVRHIKMFHGEERTVQCAYCPLTYTDKKGLYQHMHRKHPKDEHGRRTNVGRVSTPDHSGDSEDSQGLPNPIQNVPTYNCPYCPKVYTSAGGLYMHKRTKHSNAMVLPSSPLVTTNGVNPVRKDFTCPICAKEYSNYMSLYMHKKTKHPNTGPPGSTISTNGNGMAPLTPTGRREKIHQCQLCTKRYADMKGLAGHMAKMHGVPNGGMMNHHHQQQQLQQPPPPMTRSPLPPGMVLPPGLTLEPTTPLANPLHQSPSPSLSPNDKFENLHQMVPPAFAAALMTPPNMKGLMGIPIVHHIPGSNGRGKYKEKLFACPHCGKRYCDASRLKNHVDARHVTKDDQWKDVGPGVDIAVKEPHHPSGFQVFKVITIYSTGLRLKCLRYAPVDHNKWVLTDEVNKNVMKADIVKVLNMVKHEETQLFMMDNKDMGELHHGFGGGLKNGGDNESSDEEQEGGEKNGERKKEEDGERGEEEYDEREPEENGEREEEQGSEDEAEEREEEEVMVNPVFEDGASEVSENAVFEDGVSSEVSENPGLQDGVSEEGDAAMMME